MPLAKCPRCKKMFNKADNTVCSDCITLEMEDQDKVRAILDQNPNMNAEALSTKADVPIDVVHRMLEMGDLTSVSLGEQPRCGRCGAPAISASKKLCQGCLEKLNVEMARAQRTIKLKDKPQARIGEYDNKMTVVKTLEQKRNK